jgi:hypothetical protein
MIDSASLTRPWDTGMQLHVTVGDQHVMAGGIRDLVYVLGRSDGRDAQCGDEKNGPEARPRHAPSWYVSCRTIRD